MIHENRKISILFDEALTAQANSRINSKDQETIRGNIYPEIRIRFNPEEQEENIQESHRYENHNTPLCSKMPLTGNIKGNLEKSSERANCNRVKNQAKVKKPYTKPNTNRSFLTQNKGRASCPKSRGKSNERKKLNFGNQKIYERKYVLREELITKDCEYMNRLDDMAKQMERLCKKNLELECELNILKKKQQFPQTTKHAKNEKKYEGNENKNINNLSQLESPKISELETDKTYHHTIEDKYEVIINDCAKVTATYKPSNEKKRVKF
jgi:hypothetical protein